MQGASVLHVVAAKGSLQCALLEQETRKEAAPTRPLLLTRRARLKKRENQSVEGPFKFLTIAVPPGASLMM
jgi:hypothetical protein